MQHLNTYTPFFGTDHQGMTIATIADLPLHTVQLTEVPEKMKTYTIPKGNKGSVEEITAASYKLHFVFNDKYKPGEQQITFWIRRAYFDRYFNKILGS